MPVNNSTPFANALQPTLNFKYNDQGILIEESLVLSDHGQMREHYLSKFSDQGFLSEAQVEIYSETNQLTSSYTYKYDRYGTFLEEEATAYSNGIATEKDIYSNDGQPKSRILYNTNGSIRETDMWVNGKWQIVTPGPTPTPTPTPEPTPPIDVKTGGLSQQAYKTLLSQLQDTGIRTEVVNLANSGATLASYQGMLDILKNVSSTIGKTGLSANQFKDLQTLTVTFGDATGKNSYLSSISNALVNGHSSNSHWTGGSGTHTPLGNLGVGSSAYQFNGLLGKWFLGSDRPTSIYNQQGEYVMASTPLFVNGISSSDINQGSIGDCYYLAALASVAQNHPDIIKSMFIDNGNGTYGVRFYDDKGQPTYVSIDKSIDSAGTSSREDSWGALAEKAYVQFRDGLDGDNSYASINGGWAEGLTAVTGCKIVEFDGPSYRSAASWRAAVENPLIKALNNHQDIIYASMQNVYDSAGQQALVAQHMYSVLGYNQANNSFRLRNPWGGSGGQGYDVEFNVSSEILWGNGWDNSGYLFIGTQSPTTQASGDKINTMQLVQAMASFAPEKAAHMLLGNAANAANDHMLAAARA